MISHSKGGKIAIGIDIGWSEKKKSCAMAIQGCEPDCLPKNWLRYGGNGTAPVGVGLFRRSELLTFLPEFLEQLGDRQRDIVLVVDGPLGPQGPPTENRHVDGAFGRGEFNRRMQPSPVTGRDGPLYVNVTSQVIQEFFDAANCERFPPWPFPNCNGRFVYAETHPTVGLALLAPPQDRTTLPSKNRPLRTDRKTFRAKSDWYWRIGARERIAKALHSTQVENETHHERVAALYCLAVAGALAHHLKEPPKVAAIGGDDGVYVILPDVHGEWEAPLRNVGIQGGDLHPREFSVQTPEVVPVNLLPTPTPDEPTEDPEFSGADDLEFKGDRQKLVLTDNGGFWQKHNDWLVDLDEPVCVKTVDQNQIVRLKLAVNGRSSGQWVSVEEGTRSLPLAQARGFTGEHLSREESVAIEVELVECQDQK